MGTMYSMVVDGHINYDFLISRFPWLVAEKQKAIISPDTDGILCGLLMSHYYDWQVVGYYDGKHLAIKQNLRPSDCVFLDMEIYRKNIRSCGHHMVLYNKKDIPFNWDNFSECINPNVIRNYDVRNNFQEKYPLAMIHFLLCAVSSKKNISVPVSAISPLLYVDGTFKNLLNYPENCVRWLKFLNAKDKNSPIYQIYIPFANRRLSDMIHDLEKIFEKFRAINQGRRVGDKFRVSDAYTNYGFSHIYIQKIEELINLLSDLTGWSYYSDRWTLTNLNLFSYSKKIEEKINKRKYFEIINRNPISLAVTATTRIEYTLETPDNF